MKKHRQKIVKVLKDRRFRWMAIGKRPIYIVSNVSEMRIHC